MAGEIQVAYTLSGKTLYALVRNKNALIWSTVSGYFFTYTSSGLPDCDIALTAQGTASQYYVGNFPTGITTPGPYAVTAYEQVSGAPNELDLLVAVGTVYWDGATVPGMPASGFQVNVYSGQLSGHQVNLLSGNQVEVTLASGSQVLIYSGQLSGQFVRSHSGANVIVPSGLFTNASLNSGQSVLVYSGQLSGQRISLHSGQLSGFLVTAASGANVVVPSGLSTIASLYSGQLVNVNSGNLSGQFVNSHSGANVTVPSGLFVNASLNSGQPVLVYSGQLSGHMVNVLSGTANQIAGSVWDRVLTGATHNIVNSAGRRLRQLAAASIRDGTAQAGTGNSITLDAGASATDEIYDNNLVVITGGTGEGQSRVIVEYNGTTKVAMVNHVWEVNPDATSEFQIIADHQASITQHGLAQGGGAESITLSSTASSQDDIYNGQTVVIGTSTGTGQARLITAYNGTTKVASIAPAWQIQPTSASVYFILPVGSVIVESVSTSGKASMSGVFATASLNSGQLVNVNSGNLSGQFINSHSGANVVVPSGLSTIASLYSGQSVSPYSGQLSGQFVKAAVTHWITSPVIVPNTSGVPAIDVYKWYGVEMSIGPYSDLNTLKSDILSRMASGAAVSVASGDLSGQFINSHSGANVVVPSGLFTVASLNSGQSTLLYSGQFSGQPVNATATVNSGLSVIATLYSGQLVNVNSGNLSGQFVNAHSGANVIATASVASGSLYLASGSIFTNTFASGVLSDDVPDNILKRSVSGIQSILALPSLGTTVLKQTSKFNALSGVTYRLDGTTVHMTQTPVTGSGVRPIIQLNVGQ